jgi:3-oxoacyl-(acyl-carrier-protein) synthase
MHTDNDIVLTGCGLVSPAGRGRESVFQAWQQRRSALQQGSHAPQFRRQRADWFAAVPQQLTDTAWDSVPRKLRRFAPEYSAWALLATRDALSEAGLELSQVDGERCGLYCAQGDSTNGSVIPFTAALQALPPQQRNDLAAWTDELLQRRRFDPFTVIRSLGNNMLGIVSHSLQLRGDCASYVQDESAAIAAVQRAQFSLRHGYCDIAIVVASGSFNDARMLLEYRNLGYLSPCAQGADSIRGFDLEADGTALGEGACALILERADAAKARGAGVLAQIREARACSGEAGLRALAQQLRAVLPAEGADSVLLDGKGLAHTDIAQLQLLDALPHGCSRLSSLTQIIGVIGTAAPLVTLAAQLASHEHGLLPCIHTLRSPRYAALHRDDQFLPGQQLCLSLHSSFAANHGALLFSPAQRTQGPLAA